ncbi:MULTISPECIES: hypothetical protein [Bradyrhizobium]|uniref:hypothetical protein n=1 Tax=Bradyrhizobium TaxID=374 RepID=UPI0003F72425
MNVLQLSIAAMPFLLAMMSRTGKAVRPVPSDEPLHGAAWRRAAPCKSWARCLGMLIAAVAPRERLRAGWPASSLKEIARKRRGGEAPSRPISCSLVQG